MFDARHTRSCAIRKSIPAEKEWIRVASRELLAETKGFRVGQELIRVGEEWFRSGEKAFRVGGKSFRVGRKPIRSGRNSFPASVIRDVGGLGTSERVVIGGYRGAAVGNGAGAELGRRSPDIRAIPLARYFRFFRIPRCSPSSRSIFAPIRGGITTLFRHERTRKDTADTMGTNIPSNIPEFINWCVAHNSQCHATAQAQGRQQGAEQLFIVGV